MRATTCSWTARGRMFFGALLLALLALFSSRPVFAASPNGPTGSTADPSITVGGGWQSFDFGAVGSQAGPFTYSSAVATRVEVTDAFCRGDQFQVLDHGVLLGQTSAVPVDLACNPAVGNPDVAFARTDYSHGIFTLPAGSHSIVIQPIASPFGGGGAFIQVVVDSRLPICQVVGLRAGPPTQIQVSVQAEQGLASVVVTSDSNATVDIPSFTPGLTAPLMVTATKVDQRAGASLTLQVRDQAGNAVNCDPALVSVGRAPGDSPVQVIHHVAQAESHVTITNGTPGVSSLRLLVNGHSFEATDLHDGESRTLDVSSALRHGSDNTILVIAHGPRNSSAVVLVSDS